MQSTDIWDKELAILRSILIKSGLEIAIKWGAEVFTYQGKNVVSYGGFKNYFTIWFYNGVFLKDPYNVLVNASEGKTKSLRQWRFTSTKEVDENKILEYVFEAIEVEKAGLKIKPEKFKPIEIPELLATALKKNAAFNEGFKALTPGKQKEYIIYLNEPKREETRVTRLEKMIPMVIAGQGLNDKYK